MKSFQIIIKGGVIMEGKHEHEHMHSHEHDHAHTHEHSHFTSIFTNTLIMEKLTHTTMNTLVNTGSTIMVIPAMM